MSGMGSGGGGGGGGGGVGGRGGETSVLDDEINHGSRINQNHNYICWADRREVLRCHRVQLREGAGGGGGGGGLMLRKTSYAESDVVWRLS